MYNFYGITEAQVEITNKCQAACPMCSRNVRGYGVNERLVDAEWTLEGYKKIFNQEILGFMKSIIFCGCYGDPILHNELVEMVRYTTETNKEIKITINTNGSARSSKWWQQLADAIKSNPHTVIFGIDGLEDTHHLYRIGTSYDKVVGNATTFIKHGGTAEWQFIAFKHNEHQVDEARERSKSLGFKTFILIDTYRFPITDTFDVYGKDGKVTFQLQKPTNSLNKQFSVEFIKNYKAVLNGAEIDCEAKRKQAIYIDAFYHLYPCCYIAGCMYNSDRYYDPLPGNDPEVKFYWRKGYNELINQCWDVVDKIGGLDCINTYTRSIKEIIEEGTFQQVWESQWHGDNKHLMCSGQCGKTTEWSQSPDQFLEQS
jgi:MoaA/NifB/PqqE/SkfB family radical SAM enzyme